MQGKCRAVFKIFLFDFFCTFFESFSLVQPRRFARKCRTFPCLVFIFVTAQRILPGQACTYTKNSFVERGVLLSSHKFRLLRLPPTGAHVLVFVTFAYAARGQFACFFPDASNTTNKKIISNLIKETCCVIEKARGYF